MTLLDLDFDSFGCLFVPGINRVSRFLDSTDAAALCFNMCIGLLDDELLFPVWALVPYPIIFTSFSFFNQKKMTAG